MKARKTKKDLEGIPSPESHRLMQLIRSLAGIMGFSNAALARRAGVSLATLNRNFKGDAEPRLKVVLAVVPVLGLEVREFFELAYPGSKAASAARQKIEWLFRQPDLPGEAPKSPQAKQPEAPLQRKEAEKMLEDFRRDLLREVREMLSGKAQ